MTVSSMRVAAKTPTNRLPGYAQGNRGREVIFLLIYDHLFTVYGET
jgi:hypothetical protein